MRPRRVAAEANDAKRQMLHYAHCSLPVDGVSVHQAVFEQGHDGAYVVFAHLADVLEHERQGLEHAVLDVHVGGSVLVHEGGEHGEGAAGLRDDGDGDGSAHAILALLDLEIVE